MGNRPAKPTQEGNHTTSSWLVQEPEPAGDPGTGWLVPETASHVATLESERPAGGEQAGQTTASWVLEGETGSAPAFVPSKRQATAVGAYCADLCAPSEASAASAEVLDSFTGSGEDDLLRHVRAVAAKHTSVEGDQRRGWRRVLGSERQRDCASTPQLLAARANDELTESQRAEIEAHLSSCLRCQAFELRSARVERVFAGILGTGIAAATAATGLHDRDATAVLPVQAPVPEPPAAPPPAPEPVAPAPAPPVAAAEPTAPEPPPTEQHATATEPHEQSDSSSWLPTEVPIAAGVLGAAAAVDGAEAAAAEASVARTEASVAHTETAEVPTHPRARRRRLAGVAAATAAVVAAMAVAAVVLTGGSNKSHPVSAPVAAVRTPAVTSTPVRHHTVKRAAHARKHAPAKRPSHRATHTVVAAAVPTPAASAPSTPAPAASAPAASSAPATSSAPAASSAPASSPPSSAPAPAQPSVSLPQSSLGTASASQGLGK